MNPFSFLARTARMLPGIPVLVSLAGCGTRQAIQSRGEEGCRKARCWTLGGAAYDIDGLD
jgi:hypothetical protein